MAATAWVRRPIPAIRASTVSSRVCDSPSPAATSTARLSYDLSPTTEIYATLIYGAARIQNTPAGGGNGKSITLKCDNAYLLKTGLYADTAACNTANPSGSFSFGSNWENIPVNQQVFFMRTTRRYTVEAATATLICSARIGAGVPIFSMKIRQRPSHREHAAVEQPGRYGGAAAGHVVTNGNLSRFNQAADAVFNSVGQIVCRNTVAQSFGCVPFNPFGAGPISPGSQAYILNQNEPGGTTIGPSAVETVRQEAFSFSMHGSPLDDWAGPVSVATGYEYREEHYSQRGDPYGAGISASTPATVNEPCTDPFVDCGQTSVGNLEALLAPATITTAAAPITSMKRSWKSAFPC